MGAVLNRAVSLTRLGVASILAQQPPTPLTLLVFFELTFRFFALHQQDVLLLHCFRCKSFRVILCRTYAVPWLRTASCGARTSARASGLCHIALNFQGAGQAVTCLSLIASVLHTSSIAEVTSGRFPPPPLLSLPPACGLAAASPSPPPQDRPPCLWE